MLSNVGIRSVWNSPALGLLYGWFAWLSKLGLAGVAVLAGLPGWASWAGRDGLAEPQSL